VDSLLQRLEVQPVSGGIGDQDLPVDHGARRESWPARPRRSPGSSGSSAACFGCRSPPRHRRGNDRAETVPIRLIQLPGRDLADRLAQHRRSLRRQRQTHEIIVLNRLLADLISRQLATATGLSQPRRRAGLHGHHRTSPGPHSLRTSCETVAPSRQVGERGIGQRGRCRSHDRPRACGRAAHLDRRSDVAAHVDSRA
jgi:hypothetical protein